MKKVRCFILILIVIVAMMVLFSSCALFESLKGDDTIALTEDMVTCKEIVPNRDFIYSGKEITFKPSDFIIKVKGEFLSASDFDITYSDNVNVGEGKVTIAAKKGNKVCHGAVTLTFKIIGGSSSVKTEVELVAALSNKNYKDVSIDSTVTVLENTAITIAEGMTLRISGRDTLINKGTIINNGTLVISGSRMSSGSYTDGYLYNEATFENHGTITIDNSGYVYNKGTFTTDVQVGGGNRFYSNTSLAKVSDYVLRKEVSLDDLNFAYGSKDDLSVTYTFGRDSYQIVNSIGLASNPAKADITYTNNEKAGTAYCSVVIKDDDKQYYGSLNFAFLIKKGVASFSTFDEFAALLDSGNYSTYNGSSLTIPKDEAITIKEDESLVISSTSGGNVIITGSLAVCGKLVASKVTNNNYLGNMGTITLSDEIVNNGTMVNEGEITAKTYTTDNGSHDVALMTTSGTMDISNTAKFYGSATNSGSLNSNSILVYGLFENEDGTIVTNDLQLSSTGFINKQTACVTINSSTKESCFSYPFVNDGEITNNGTIIIKTTESITNNEIHNVGEIYSYQDLSGVDGNAIIRRIKLTESDLSLDNSSIVYSGSEIKPIIMKDGNPFDSSLISVVYRQDAKIVSPINVGTYEVHAVLLTEKCGYWFENTYISLPYTITQAVANVDNVSSLNSALTSDNYSGAKLVADITASSYSVCTVPAGKVLNLNGYKFTIADSATLNLYGKIVSKKELATLDIIEDNIGLKIIGTLQSANGCEIESDDITYIDSKSASVSDITFSNSGVIFTNYDIPAEKVSGGVVHSRLTLGVLKALDRVSILGSDFEYAGSAITPSIDVKINGVSIEDSRLVVSYVNNNCAGTATAIISAANSFDEDICGSVSLDFDIAKGKKEICGEIDSTAFDSNCSRFVLTGDVTLTSDIKIPNDCDLDIGDYDISFEGHTIGFAAEGQLLVNVSSKAKFDKYKSVAYGITLSANISETLDFTPISCGVNVLCSYSELIIDLNGYNLTGGINISSTNSNIRKLSITNTSDVASAIGYDGMDYSLTLGDWKDLEVDISKVTIYGVRITNTKDPHETTFSNCNIYCNSTQFALSIDERNTDSTVFNNCTISGKNAVVITGSKKLTFNDCSISSDGPYSGTKGHAVYIYRGSAIDVGFNSCLITSSNGYGLYISGSIAISTNGSTISGALGSEKRV